MAGRDYNADNYKAQQRIAKATEEQTKALFRIARALEALKPEPEVNDDVDYDDDEGNLVRILTEGVWQDLVAVIADVDIERKQYRLAYDGGFIGWFGVSEVEPA